MPTLLWSGSGALYGVRLVGALLDSALVALGLFLLARYHPRRRIFLGAMVALTPMVLFISAVVSSSGMETAAGFAAWCSGLCVIERPVIPGVLAAWTSVSFVALILSRPLSPVNAFLIVAVLATLLGWRRSRALIREPSLRPIWIPALAATLAAGAFLIVVGSPSLIGVAEKPSLSLIESVRLTLRLTSNRLHQCVGDFGWSHKLPAPRWVVALWTSVLVGLLACAVALSRRCRRALPLLVLAILAMPVIFESSRIDTVGTYWQGRYWLPLAVGLPLVASSLEPGWVVERARSILVLVTPTLRQAGFVTVGVLLVVAQVATFLTALHHYEQLAAKAGSTVKWTPPGGTTLVVSLFIAGQILLLSFLTRKLPRPGERLSMTGVRFNMRSRQPQPTSV